MIVAGMDVARLSFAHGDPAEHLEAARRVRALAGEAGRQVGVMADLPGPKVRAGAFPAEGAELVDGATLTVATGEGSSSGGHLEVVHPSPDLGLREGDLLGLGDGTILLRVEEAHARNGYRVRVHRGGTVQGRPGVILPDLRVGLRSPTDDDLEIVKQYARFFDILAISFVRSASDIVRLRDAAGDQSPMILAKIETAESVANLASIIDVADGVMVARGDLGNRLPIEDVPHVQKQVIRACVAAGRPVITATQMLESMVTAVVPTRAEVSDVANAVFDGTDAVMLSAETAVGRDPAHVVSTMATIAERAEREADYPQWGGRLAKMQRAARGHVSVRARDGITHAAWRAAVDVDAAAILCITETGAIARDVARFRPAARLLAVTPRPTTARQLALTWGVGSIVAQRTGTTMDENISGALRNATRLGHVAAGQVVVVVAAPFGEDDSSNASLVIAHV